MSTSDKDYLNKLQRYRPVIARIESTQEFYIVHQFIVESKPVAEILNGLENDGYSITDIAMIDVAKSHKRTPS